jgi:hypothetical protein
MSELPQNLKTALQEVGELSSLIYLHLLIECKEHKEWKVFRNYADAGCDIVLMGPGKQINLEVKSRQTITASGNPNVCHFTVTPNERKSCQFVLAYWLNKETFFIVPTSDLKSVNSNGKVLYKFIAAYSESNLDFTDSCRHYAGDWAAISEAIENA